MDKKLIVESTKDGKKYQKTYGNLNPAATDEQVEGFAQQTNALTTNAYQGAYLITKRALHESDTGGGSGSAPSDFTQIVMDNFASKFAPPVSSPADFVEHAADNIQYFDSKLQKVLQGSDYALTFNQSETFHDGKSTISFAKNGSSIYAVNSAANDSLFIAADSSTATYSPQIAKLSETAGLIYYPAECQTSGGYSYHGAKAMKSFTFTDADKVTVKSTLTLATACGTNSSGVTDNPVELFRTPANPGTVVYTAGQVQSTLETWAFNAKVFNVANAETVTTASSNVGSVYSATAGKTNNIDTLETSSSTAPVITFNKENVTLAKGEVDKPLPFVTCVKRTRDASGNITAGSAVAYINLGYADSITPCVFGTAEGDEPFEFVLPWFTDDGATILGVFTSYNNECFVITYKPGTYPKETWLTDAFDVWAFKFSKVANSGGKNHFYKTSLTLPDILPNLNL